LGWNSKDEASSGTKKKERLSLIPVVMFQMR